MAAPALADRAGGRSRHRQDDDGGARPGACWPISPVRLRTSRWRRPTGKAAARLAEAVRDAVATCPPADQERLGELTASTLHRLLGFRPGSRSRFRHHAGNRLAHDIVVVDESSMISLTLMARLLDAVRPDARLILVGDPEQLASVEAGAVLADIVDAGPPPARRRVDSGIVVLQRSWRFTGRIAELARAVQAGDADAVMGLLRTPAEDVSFVGEPSRWCRPLLRPAATCSAVCVTTSSQAARQLDRGGAIGRRGGGAATSAHTVCCAPTATGPTASTAGGRSSNAGSTVRSAPPQAGEWYPGRPLLVTANDYEVKLFNGDTGVVISDGAGAVTAAFGRPGGSGPDSPGPARRGADHAGDDRASQPGLAVPAGVGAAAGRGFAAAHPSAALHGRHPGREACPRHRDRGRRPGRRHHPDHPGERAARPALAGRLS